MDVTVIRDNASEIVALRHAVSQTKDVDAIHTVDDDPEAVTRALSEIVRLAKIR